jgi:hypothetical protein
MTCSISHAAPEWHPLGGALRGEHDHAVAVLLLRLAQVVRVANEVEQNGIGRNALLYVRNFHAEDGCLVGAWCAEPRHVRFGFFKLCMQAIARRFFTGTNFARLCRGDRCLDCRLRHCAASTSPPLDRGHPLR